MIGFVGLNPSTADGTEDDPTLRRLMGFSRRWGFGGLVLVNLYAYRATDPKRLRQVADPVGPRTDFFIRKALSQVEQVVVCWGASGASDGRAEHVMRRLRQGSAKVVCLGTNADGSPKHPLYLSNATERVPYLGAEVPKC